MSDLFEYILDSEDSTHVEYKITLDADGTVFFLEISTCSAQPRLWASIPTQIAKDLKGFDEALLAANEHFMDLSDGDEASFLSWDSARTAQGLRGE